MLSKLHKKLSPWIIAWFVKLLNFLWKATLHHLTWYIICVVTRILRNMQVIGTRIKTRSNKYAKNILRNIVSHFMWVGKGNMRRTILADSDRQQIIIKFYPEILSPRNVLTGLGDNYVSKCSSDSFPHTKICHHAWKTLRTTLWCFVFLQSRGEGLKSKENYGTDLSHSCSPLYDLFPTIKDQRCIAM